MQINPVDKHKKFGQRYQGADSLISAIPNRLYSTFEEFLSVVNNANEVREWFQTFDLDLILVRYRDVNVFEVFYGKLSKVVLLSKIPNTTYDPEKLLTEVCQNNTTSVSNVVQSHDELDAGFHIIFVSSTSSITIVGKNIYQFNDDDDENFAPSSSTDESGEDGMEEEGSSSDDE